jgi:hypothetical protein
MKSHLVSTIFFWGQKSTMLFYLSLSFLLLYLHLLFVFLLVNHPSTQTPIAEPSEDNGKSKRKGNKTLRREKERSRSKEKDYKSVER